MALRPIFYHKFPHPLPYAATLSLQNEVYRVQLQQRHASPDRHDDYLLLLQHRPVYTAGRRQTEDEVRADSDRLRNLGADFMLTKRGGQITYHGPGQVVGYPLVDLRRMQLSIRDYVDRIQVMLKRHFLQSYSISSIASDNTGVFTAPNAKLASIGVQVRHRLTSHGFAYNVTREPRPWFDQIVACGLADVTMESVSTVIGKDVAVDDDLQRLLPILSQVFMRELVELDIRGDGPVENAVRSLEKEAANGGSWPIAPNI